MFGNKKALEQKLVQQGGVVAWATIELTKLADLRDRGALTEDEFAAQKAKLLASG